MGIQNRSSARRFLVRGAPARKLLPSWILLLQLLPMKARVKYGLRSNEVWTTHAARWGWTGWLCCCSIVGVTMMRGEEQRGSLLWNLEITARSGNWVSRFLNP